MPVERSRRDNAFVAGFGPTKRVVIYDTMLEHPAVTVEQVVAHEIGHYRLQHIFTSLPAALLSTLMTFGLMQAATTWDALLDVAGVDALRDPGSLPLFMAVFAVLQMVTGCRPPCCLATTSGRPTSRACGCCATPARWSTCGAGWRPRTSPTSSRPGGSGSTPATLAPPSGWRSRPSGAAQRRCGRPPAG